MAKVRTEFVTGKVKPALRSLEMGAKIYTEHTSGILGVVDGSVAILKESGIRPGGSWARLMGKPVVSCFFPAIRVSAASRVIF